jgi:hypothetical protein
MGGDVENNGLPVLGYRRCGRDTSALLKRYVPRLSTAFFHLQPLQIRNALVPFLCIVIFRITRQP